MEKFSENKKIENKESIEKRVGEMLQFQENFEGWVEKTKYIAFSYLDHVDELEDAFRGFKDFNYFCFDYAHMSENQPEIVDFLNKESEARELLSKKYKELGIDDFTLWFIDLFNEMQEITKQRQDYEPVISHQYFGAISLDSNHSIHFDKFRDQENEQMNTAESLSSIVDFYNRKGIFPEKITAESWLMGRDSLRDSLGFKKVEEYDFTSDDLDPRVLGQCIDGDGNLKEKYIKYFFEKNELPYKRTKAEISIEDFILKYGSKKYESKIILIEDNSEYIKEKDASLKQSETFSNYFQEHINSASFEEIQAELFKIPAWQIFKDHQDAEKFFEIIRGIIHDIQIEGKNLGDATKTYEEDLSRIKKESFEPVANEYLNQFKKIREHIIKE